jgi:hypothetical protein
VYDDGQAVPVRMVSAPSNTPAAVAKYLLPDEWQVIVVRFHPARFIPPLVTAIGGLFLAIALSPVVRGDMARAVWVITLLLIGNLVRTFYNWFSVYFVATSHRIFTCDGSGITLEMPLTDVKCVRLTRPPGGRILGYGTLVFDSARLAVDCLPYPEQLYLELLGLLYKPAGADD